jgi:hypothetical protein
MCEWTRCVGVNFRLSVEFITGRFLQKFLFRNFFELINLETGSLVPVYRLMCSYLEASWLCAPQVVAGLSKSCTC